MPSSSSSSRRLHSAQFKARVLAACNQPSACVREVADAHGVHMNLVRKWRGKAKAWLKSQPKRVERSKQSAFIAVPLKPESPSEQLVAQVRCGRTEVVMYWPLSHAKQCLQGLMAACHDAA